MTEKIGMNNISMILLGIWLDNQIISEVASIIYKVRADSATYLKIVSTLDYVCIII